MSNKILLSLSSFKTTAHPKAVGDYCLGILFLKEIESHFVKFVISILGGQHILYVNLSMHAIDRSQARVPWFWQINCACCSSHANPLALCCPPDLALSDERVSSVDTLPFPLVAQSLNQSRYNLAPQGKEQQMYSYEDSILFRYNYNSIDDSSITEPQHRATNRSTTTTNENYCFGTFSSSFCLHSFSYSARERNKGERV